MTSLTTLKTNYPTWSDLSEPSLTRPLPVKTDGKDAGGGVAILVSTIPDMALMEELAGALAASRSFYMGKCLTDEKGVAIAGPYMGAPYAAMLLESLIAGGIGKVFILGWCGSLDEHIGIGDFVVPSSLIQDEGISRHYLETGKSLCGFSPVRDAYGLLESHLKNCGGNVHKAVVWTTDAIYRETASKVAWFREQGAQVVDMECSALFSVAAFHKMDVEALLVVSDMLEGESWKPGFSQKHFKQARKKACQYVLDTARSMISQVM